MKLKNACIPALILLAFSCSGIRLAKYPSENCAKVPGANTFSIIQKRCYTCHKGDFATAEQVCTRRTMIIDAVSSKRMPKYGSLSIDEIKEIQNWDR